MMKDLHVKLNRVLPWQKQHSQEEGSLHQQKGLKCKKYVTCYIWSTALYDAEPWTL